MAKHQHTNILMNNPKLLIATLIFPPVGITIQYPYPIKDFQVFDFT